MKAIRAAALVALALVPAACRTVPPAVPLAADDPRPLALMAALAERAGARRALRGGGKLAVDAGDLRVRSELALVLERPARLRVEVRGLFGQTLAVLATDGRRFEYFLPAERSYEAGPVYPDLLWDVVNVPLRPEEVVDLLLGIHVPAAGARLARALEAGRGAVEVELTAPDGTPSERLVFDAESRLRGVAWLGPGGQVSRHARFDDYEMQDGIAFARRIEVDFPARAVRAELSLRTVELNPSLSPGVFRLDPVAPQAASEGSP